MTKAQRNTAIRKLIRVCAALEVVENHPGAEAARYEINAAKNEAMYALRKLETAK